MDQVAAFTWNAWQVSVEYAHVKEYMRRRKPYLTSARQEATLLGTVFNYAIGELDVETENPVEKIKKPKMKPRRRYVADEEYQKVWSLAIPQVQVVMDLSLLTGLRRGDILALTRDNLTKQGLLVQTSKTDVGLEFEYTDELEAVLKKALSLKPQVGPGHYLVRSRNGTGYSNSGFSAIWQRLMTKAVAQGVERFQFRDIRAKSASDSASVAEASARLGHASESITRRVYMRVPAKVKPLK